MGAAFTGKEPDVTPEAAEVTSQTGVHFSSEKAMQEHRHNLPGWVALRVAAPNH